MNRKIIAVVAVLGALTLSGCNSYGQRVESTTSDTLYEETITIEDGREVTCIIFAAGYKGGLSCDWEGAK